MTYFNAMTQAYAPVARKNGLSLCAAVLALCVAASSAGAEQAVQWRAEDGGNGHWYKAVSNGTAICWEAARDAAIASGGHLATLTSAAEDAWVCAQLVQSASGMYPPGCGWDGPMTGGFKLSGDDWQWVTGEPFEYSNFVWSNGSGREMIQYFNGGCGWDGTGYCGGACGGNIAYLMEWSADCNGDGYVDYGQILQGELVDSNTNGTPDCCEAGTPCEADNPPVQWRVEDGGNGHWYQIVELANRPTCSEAASLAAAVGAKLIALETAPEADFFRSLRCSQGKQHLSGWQDLHRIDGVWTWGSGAPFTYQSWSTGQPDFGDTATIDWAGPSGQCDSITWGDEICMAGNLPSSLFLEWSDDCNGDGFVDYGQMLAGAVPDVDGDGIPDTCEDADSDGDPEGRDCDDSDPTRYTFAPETCSDLGIDNDCDGDVFDTPDDSVTYHFDGDGDGIGGTTAPFPGQCPGTIPAGYSESLGDCDDENADIYPGAMESCDSIDSDCDSSLVDSFDDTDGDGYPDCIDEVADNDGVHNSEDAFPFDPTESVDTDGDGIGDNADTDDDDDGVDDVVDNCPLAANSGQADCNGDGIGDACQLLEDDVGFVRAWGRNDFGQTNIPSDLGVCKAIDAGLWGTTAVIQSDGMVRVVGVNWYHPETTVVPNDLGACRAIAAGGAHVLAVRVDGQVRSWGPPPGASAIPPSVNSPTSIASGAYHNLAILGSGHVVAWGANEHGQCNIPGDEQAGVIGAGQAHSLIVRLDGTISCYGWNDAGQSSPPVSTPPLITVDGGFRHSIGLSSDGRLYAWGSNNHGQTTIPDGIGRVIDVDAGGNHNVALRSDGTVVCWGFNASGACEPPAGLGVVRAIAAGGDDYYRGGHTLVLTAGGYSDCDGSGTLDLCDVDDDSDGVPNACADTDGDGDSSATDCDDSDADRYTGALEACDGIDNDCDTDVDEGFVDSDGDGLADCMDPDDDNDGVPDSEDAFPLDPSESVDTDGDGIGDNADPDDDNDGLDDALDNCPSLSNPSQADCNNDGLGDACEVASGAADTDANGVPDTCQDCNQDGIFDPIQTALGQLADYDIDGVPDCCQQGTVCVVGRYPVQWRVGQGGNGHWYLVAAYSSELTWRQARDEALAIGGDLASVTSAEAHGWISPFLSQVSDTAGCNPVIYIGLSKEPGHPWAWTNGDSLDYTNWHCAEPYDPDYPEGKGVAYGPAACESQCVVHTKWDDFSSEYAGQIHRGLLIEWSSDCDGDGIVDYGQILRGEIADANANGIPDTCEEPPCDADIDRNGVVDATDLAMVLSQWGTSGGSPSADVTGDGMVEGKDLAIVVSAWGPCSSDPG